MFEFPSIREWQFMMWAAVHREGFKHIRLYVQLLPYKVSISVSYDGCIYISLNRTWVGMFMNCPYGDHKAFCLMHGLDPEDNIPF